MEREFCKPTFLPDTWTVVVWLCCGHRWELIIHPRYPWRNYWAPTCPSCSEKGESVLSLSREVFI